MALKIAVLAPVAWRTPPRHYGPWEQMASNHAEGLIKRGHEVTLFATADSITAGKLEAVIPASYEEDRNLDPKVVECLHISHLMEQAGQFDLIHNHYDFLPLTYSKLISTPMVTTIHGFSSEKILAVYRKYNNHGHYISISNSDRSDQLKYLATVYNGIDTNQFSIPTQPPEDYLLFFGRIHPHKGTKEAIEIAKQSHHRLIISGIIQDENYFKEFVEPELNDQIVYVGSTGDDDRKELLGKAKALLHPISFDEPFGLSVVESMACGTPVIAFNRGAMPELIEDGKNGYLVSGIDETIERLSGIETLITPENREKIRQRVKEKFSIDSMVENYLAAYRKLGFR